MKRTSLISVVIIQFERRNKLNFSLGRRSETCGFSPAAERRQKQTHGKLVVVDLHGDLTDLIALFQNWHLLAANNWKLVKQI